MKKLSIFPLLLLFIFNIHAANVINIKPGVNQATKSNRFFDLNLRADSSPIKIVNNYPGISSISELLDIFKGKPVFIDLWATWCSPCIQEFKFSDSLYDFLNQHGVEIIYVSIDKEPTDILWRNIILENKLSGNHVKASKLLRDDLTTLVWGGINVSSIPHYLLFDKDKRLVNKDTSHPSSGQTLFKEIVLALNKL